MRLLILLAGPALVLAACSNDNQPENTVKADEGLSAESFSTNDITAIDAVTAEASNMAADVDYTVESNDSGGGESQPKAAGKTPETEATPRRSRDAASADAAAEAEQPSANATAAATANNAL